MTEMSAKRVSKPLPPIKSVTIQRSDGSYLHARWGSTCRCGQKWSIEHIIEILEEHK